MEFDKLGASLLGLWSIITGEQLCLVKEIDLDTIKQVLHWCFSALNSSDTYIASQACSIIDNMVSHVCTNNLLGKAQDTISVRLRQTSDICQELLAVIFDKLINEDVNNQWSMTRSLLPLVLLFPEYFQQIVQQCVAQQHQHLQEAYGKSMLSIMEGINFSLEAKNRDRFTSNLTVARRQISNICSITSN